MGCNIHMYAETRKDINSPWEKVGRVFPNEYYDPKVVITIDEYGFQWNAQFTDQPYTGRNYDLFAILANVRNGRGFAGIKTSEGFNCISFPRGIPYDVSVEAKKELLSYGVDGHSHSWFTVKELKDFDCGQLTMQRGIISLEDYLALKVSGKSEPDSWCGSISGPDIIIIDEDEVDDYLKKPTKIDIYINYHWGSLYSEACEFFLKNTIPSLEALGGRLRPDRVFFRQLIKYNI